MKVRQLMTLNARYVTLQTSLTEAAQVMQQLNVGALPVCENDALAGIVTDRDIILRAIALGRAPETTTVADVMSLGIVFIYEDQTREEAAQMMERHQIRRLPVLNRDEKLVGIISLGDLAAETETHVSGEVLKEISTPSAPTR